MASPLISLLVTGVLLALAYFVIQRSVLSPLSTIPGPWHTLFSDLILMYHEFTGNRRLYIHRLHKQYGSIVRLGPNEVSFTSVEALKEIYQSGGSGYDKTRFYELFMQYDTRYVVPWW